jgi:uncharacterized SAM-binding protein YcdF (DUF218 family)
LSGTVFWLKKLVGFWLMPLPLGLALLVAGVVLARWSRWRRLGRALVMTAAILLVLVSNNLVSNRLLSPLESLYPAMPEFTVGVAPPAPLDGCAFVAVLGGGHSDMPQLPAASRLSSSALGRIVEAVRLMRALPGARLILSGPGEPGRPTHAAVLSLAAQSLGVDPARIILVDSARDTEEEAFAVAAIAKGARVALVTSAWHMPRAAVLFRRAAVAFVPCPADFVARANAGHPWGALSWDSESLERSTLALHEWIGLLWLKVRGIG